MSQLGNKFRSANGILMFWCPGCEELHQVRISTGGWAWNGNIEKPTFEPSILVRSGHHMRSHEGECWCSYNTKKIAAGEAPSKFKCKICHSFVRDGQIQFLGDCTHALSGQTVPLPDLPAELRD